MWIGLDALTASGHSGAHSLSAGQWLPDAAPGCSGVCQLDLQPGSLPAVCWPQVAAPHTSHMKLRPLVLAAVSSPSACCLCGCVRCHAAQGVLPAGLEKVKSQELREFITQCIAHDPDSRPDTRQLLKHPFFESIRTGKVQVERGTTLADRPSEEVQVRGG